MLVCGWSLRDITPQSEHQPMVTGLDAVSPEAPVCLELLSGLFDKYLSGLNIFLNSPRVTLLIGKAHLHYKSRGTKWSHC